MDSEGRTAVHYAAFFGKHHALKFLIEAASDWNPRYGTTIIVGVLYFDQCFYWTVTNKDPNCILALVEAYPPLLNRRYIFTNNNNTMIPSRIMIKIVDMAPLPL